MTLTQAEKCLHELRVGYERFDTQQAAVRNFHLHVATAIDTVLRELNTLRHKQGAGNKNSNTRAGCRKATHCTVRNCEHREEHEYNKECAIAVLGCEPCKEIGEDEDAI